jgi:hypothetical protein
MSGLRSPSVVIVQATQHGYRCDVSGARRWDKRRNVVRSLLPDALVRSGTIEVRDILAQHSPLLALVQDNYVIQALAAQAPKESLTDSIGPRSHVRCAQYFNPTPRRHPGEHWAELRVIVANEIAWALVEGGGLAQLLGDPGISRVPRHPDMDYPTCCHLDQDEGVDGPEEEIGHGNEITRPDGVGVVAQKGGPLLATRSRRPSAPQVLLDRPLREADAELEEFTSNSFGTLQPIVRSHLQDESDRLCRHL